MANKRLSVTELTTAGSKMLYKLGSRFIQPATSDAGEKEYMYVEYDDGTANITANTFQVVVPHTGNLQLYTADKTNMQSNSEGRYAGICMANVTTTSNKYFFIQIGGESHIAGEAGAKTPAGSTIIATPAGTDKIVEFITYTATTTAAKATTAALPAQFATSIGYGTTTGATNINLNGFK